MPDALLFYPFHPAMRTDSRLVKGKGITIIPAGQALIVLLKYFPGNSRLAGFRFVPRKGTGI
jgi:hypothetical protein